MLRDPTVPVPRVFAGLRGFLAGRYTIFSDPALAATVIPFLDEAAATAGR
jgi:hypothetical protein